MGISPESPVVSRMRNREGIALIAAIFGIVIISLITAGAFALTDLDTKATYNRADASTAMRLAHTAQAHALSLFRTHLADTTINRLFAGQDNATGTADDGLFISWTGIDNTIDIPAAGRTTADGTYWATMMDDPNDSNVSPFIDANWRFLVRCAGQTPRGSRAVIDFVVKYLPPVPAVAMNGNTVIQGGPAVTGACGNIHMNSNVTVAGNLTVNRYLTVSGTPSGSGDVYNAGGIEVGAYQVPDQIPIPTMTAAEHCPGALYVLRADGQVLDRTTGLTVPPAPLGWAYTVVSGKVLWTSQSTVVTGSYCAMGNVTISGGPGAVGTPLPLSVYATGSINVAGNPNLRPFGTNNIIMLADGDIYIAGNSNTNYEGIIYGGSNCRASGNLRLSGQFLCQSGPLPAVANEIVASNLIEGNPRFDYSCTWANANDKYKIVSWYQRIGA